MSNSIDRMGPRPEVLDRRPGVPAVEGRIPLSSHQQRVWLSDQMNPQSPLYNISSGYRLYGELDREAFVRALDALVLRHEPLRTRIVVEDHAPVQVIDPPQPSRTRFVDLRPSSRAEREGELERRLREEACAPFDLSGDLMIRVLGTRSLDELEPGSGNALERLAFS